MRLLIIGALDGQIGAASQIAMAQGARVVHVDTVDRGARGAALGPGRRPGDGRRDLRYARPWSTAWRPSAFSIPVVACGIGTDANAAVRAIKAGAQEYIPLPPDAELIAAVLAAVAEENHAIISRDPGVAQVLKLAEQVAKSDASVLITGESGTGKEVLARYIHRKSRRNMRRFISVNCAAIPENLLESELFGHEKGAFTGAVARRIGKFEEANGGTLLLDEISEMDQRLQAKLLRAIQEREIDRVGGTPAGQGRYPHHRHLEPQSRGSGARRHFPRGPLFPPQRGQSAPAAAARAARGYRAAGRSFRQEIRRAERRAGAPDRRPRRKKMLFAHAWRGNVRELENAMHRAVLLATGAEIGPDAVMLSDAHSARRPRRFGGRRHGRRPRPAPRGWSAAPWPMSSAT